MVPLSPEDPSKLPGFLEIRRIAIKGSITSQSEFARGEAAKNDVSVQMDLADGLPLIEGDKVQLQ
jgi:hypothetical protein